MVEPSNGPAAGYCLIWLLLFTGFYWFSGLYWFSGERGGREGGEMDGERGMEKEERGMEAEDQQPAPLPHNLAH